MSVIHYKHDMNMTSEPLCKRAPVYADGALREHMVTCKSCLKLLAAKLVSTLPATGGTE